MPDDKYRWPWMEGHLPSPERMSGCKEWPKITLVTPSYNQGQYLEETIRSVLLQEYPNLQYLVIDGGSTDGSVDVIRQYEGSLSYWTSQRDEGQSDAINKGMVRATGEILGWLNSDDVLCPGALHTVAEAWRRHSPCHFLTGDGEYVSTNRAQVVHTIRARAYSFADLLHFAKGKYLPQPSVFFSRKAFEKVGGLDTGLTYAMDFDLWLRLRLRYPLHYVSVCLSQLRLHEDAKTANVYETCQAIEQVMGRYLHHVGVFEQLRIRCEFRRFWGVSMCGKGLRSYFGEASEHAAQDFRSALRLFPGVLATRAGLGLFLRLTLPSRLKVAVLNKP
jgi:glycosyltransferase involved in cell wall biosynthesis